MIPRGLRALGFTIGWACAAPAWAQGTWTAAFPGSEGPAAAGAFAVGDGRQVVSVAVSGVNGQGGEVLDGDRSLPCEVFLEPVSRLVVFRLSGPPGRALPLGGQSVLKAGEAILGPGGFRGRSNGRVTRIGGKILPLALEKIDYSGAVPPPGTPLMNAAGQVVAVAHQPADGKSGYALPVEVVRRVVDDVRRSGRLRRGWLGLALRPDAAEPQVTRVTPGSPAALAGIVRGDVLLEIDGRSLAEYGDAVNAFFFLRPGAAVPVKVKRGGNVRSVTLEPVEKPGAD